MKDKIIFWALLLLVAWIVMCGIWKNIELISSLFGWESSINNTCKCKASCSYENYIKENLEEVILSAEEMGEEFCKSEGFDGGFLNIRQYPEEEVVVHCYGKETTDGELSKKFTLSEVLNVKRSWE